MVWLGRAMPGFNGAKLSAEMVTRKRAPIVSCSLGARDVLHGAVHAVRATV